MDVGTALSGGGWAAVSVGAWAAGAVLDPDGESVLPILLVGIVLEILGSSG